MYRYIFYVEWTIPEFWVLSRYLHHRHHHHHHSIIIIVIIIIIAIIVIIIKEGTAVMILLLGSTSMFGCSGNIIVYIEGPFLLWPYDRNSNIYTFMSPDFIRICEPLECSTIFLAKCWVYLGFICTTATGILVACKAQVPWADMLATNYAKTRERKWIFSVVWWVINAS